MSITSLSAARLAEAEVCLSRRCRLSVWWRLRCVCHVPVSCPSGGGCGVSVTSLSAVRLAEAVVCLSRHCRLSFWWRLRCVCHVAVGCLSGGG